MTEYKVGKCSEDRRTSGGKGDKDRADLEKYREGWDKIFGNKKENK